MHRFWIGILIFVGISQMMAADNAAPRPDTKDLAAYLGSLPAAEIPGFTQERAMALMAMPLACLDHPHSVPEQRTDYLWTHDSKPHILDTYSTTRAFYGCSDWHSAVNSTWTLITMLKQFPEIPVGKLIREKLREHLGKKNIEGEMEFFKTAKNFEVPYGYAWLLKVYAELVNWTDPEANTWAQNLAPMAQQFSKKLVEYFTDLQFPSRAGMHPNTTNAIGLLLEYSGVVNDVTLKEVLLKTANRFFLKDKNCPTAYEPAGTDFLSPCLSEARLMSLVLDSSQYVSWLERFLPPAYSEAFKPLTLPVDVSGVKKKELEGGKSHLIGLGFSRGQALLDIANALPREDPRIPVLRRLAAINVTGAYRALADAGYAGSHWFATYAVLFAKADQMGRSVPVSASTHR
jgi:hypothetical protein